MPRKTREGRRAYQREYRRRLDVKFRRNQSYCKQYGTGPQTEPEYDPNLIARRIEAVLKAKQDKWALHHTTTSLSNDQIAALVLPGD
jgi:hypothetical protein